MNIVTIRDAYGELIRINLSNLVYYSNHQDVFTKVVLAGTSEIILLDIKVEEFDALVQKR